MRMPHWLKHDWDKWSDPVRKDAHFYTFGVRGDSVSVLYQQRSCRVCGLTQESFD